MPVNLIHFEFSNNIPVVSIQQLTENNTCTTGLKSFENDKTSLIAFAKQLNSSFQHVSNLENGKFRLTVEGLFRLLHQW